jgi:hypothetical protein
MADMPAAPLTMLATLATRGTLTRRTGSTGNGGNVHGKPLLDVFWAYTLSIKQYGVGREGLHDMCDKCIILFMKRISVLLSVPQLEALKTLAKKLGLSFSETLRRAIDVYLEQQKREQLMER